MYPPIDDHVIGHHGTHHLGGFGNHQNAGRVRHTHHVTVDAPIKPKPIGKLEIAHDTAAHSQQALDGRLFFSTEHGLSFLSIKASESAPNALRDLAST